MQARCMRARISFISHTARRDVGDRVQPHFAHERNINDCLCVYVVGAENLVPNLNPIFTRTRAFAFPRFRVLADGETE